MPLRASFRLSWKEFIATWCLGITPAYTEQDVTLALEAVERCTPERLDQLERSGQRGVLLISSAVHFGTVLKRCEPLQGFAPVLARLRAGEESALAELEVAAALVQIGLVPQLEPELGGKKLDAGFRYDGRDVYVEVIAPERSDAMKEASEAIHSLASRLANGNPGTRIEVLLTPPFSTDNSDDIVARVNSAQWRSVQREIAGIATFTKEAAPSTAIVSPRIAWRGESPVLGVGQGSVNGSVVTVVLVRLPMDDERAQRVLAGELHHFSRETPNLLIMNVTSVVGGMKGWTPLIEKCFQPTRNRRIGAVLLYEMMTVGLRAQIWERWRLVRNPHAYVPIPERLLDSLATLDQGEYSVTQ